MKIKTTFTDKNSCNKNAGRLESSTSSEMSFSPSEITSVASYPSLDTSAVCAPCRGGLIVGLSTSSFQHGSNSLLFSLMHTGSNGCRTNPSSV